MCWGHERLVGCRALSPAIRERACPATGSRPQVTVGPGRSRWKGGTGRWRCSAGSTGPRTITTSRWSTRTETSCWPSAGSATTRPGSPRCCSCWPRPGTARRPDPGGDRDQPRPVGGLPARHRTPGVSRSTRWRCRATGIGTRVPGASPTPATRWCWPTSCAPTWPRTARCPPTPSWPRRSRCWPAPNRTRSGRAPTRTTSCARCCASSTPPCWPRSPPSAAGCCAPRPARCWPPPPPRARPPG